jgi:hypothetical protein
MPYRYAANAASLGHFEEVRRIVLESPSGRGASVGARTRRGSSTTRRSRQDALDEPTATPTGVGDRIRRSPGRFLAAVVQFLGLARWPFLVPALARAYSEPASSQATREATAVAFESFHRYLGIGIGECLGYLLTGAWTMLVGVAMLRSSRSRRGSLCRASSSESSSSSVPWSSGRFEERGWKVTGAIVPIAYIAWSLWLIVSGVVLLVG